MYTVTAELSLRINCSNSLKDKRRVIKSIVDRVRSRYNVSIAEVDTQESLKTITIGMATVSSEYSHAKHCMDDIINFIETSADADLFKVVIL